MAKALLITDMINDFVHPDGKLYLTSSEDIIPRIQDKIAEYAKNGDLIIFVKDDHLPGDEEFGLFPEHALKGTWGSENLEDLLDKVTGVSFSVVSKNRFSAFYGTNLEELLKSNDIDEVDVVGVCTHICVMDTVQGLNYRRIKINVYKDMVADIDKDLGEAALKRMASIYGANVI